MKHTLIIIIVILIGCSNGMKTSEQSLSLKSYNLKGKIEYISDKKIPSILIDNDMETQIDTTHLTSISFQNKYFNKNGYLTNLKYYDKDSVLLINSKILFSDSGKYKGSKDFNKEGQQLKNTKIVSSNIDFLEIKTYDYKTGELLSKSKTEYENGLVKKQYSEFESQGHKSEYIYKRDNEGNEIEISMILEFSDQKIESKSFVKYMEFDKYGNWIKRIDYNKEKGNECLVTIRDIRYYE